MAEFLVVIIIIEVADLVLNIKLKCKQIQHLFFLNHLASHSSY